jgi:hypothetical protein
MRIVLAALLTVGAVSVAQAQVRVEDAEVVRRGLYEAGTLTTIDDDSISTGHRTTAKKMTFKENTTRIVAKDGVVFGLDLVVHGSPRGRTIPVRVVWRYPEPGLRNPSTRDVKFRDEYDDKQTIGTEGTYYWTLGDEWTRVPGDWTFELWYNGRMLTSKTFTLVKE